MSSVNIKVELTDGSIKEYKNIEKVERGIVLMWFINDKTNVYIYIYHQDNLDFILNEDGKDIGNVVNWWITGECVS